MRLDLRIIVTLIWLVGIVCVIASLLRRSHETPLGAARQLTTPGDGRSQRDADEGIATLTQLIGAGIFLVAVILLGIMNALGESLGESLARSGPLHSAFGVTLIVAGIGFSLVTIGGNLRMHAPDPANEQERRKFRSNLSFFIIFDALAGAGIVVMLYFGLTALGLVG